MSNLTTLVHVEESNVTLETVGSMIVRADVLKNALK